MNIIRLEDSFEVLGKAILTLDEVIKFSVEQKNTIPNTIVIDSTITRFKYVFECFWKFLKRYLEMNGELVDNIKIPKQILIKAYEYKLIDNEVIWLNMLKDRNILSHVYNEEEAFRVYYDIVETYYPTFKDVYDKFEKLMRE